MAVEQLRGNGGSGDDQDCSVFLVRLVNAGFLDVVRDTQQRRANRYRLTTVALQAMGVARPEELRATLGRLLGEPAAQLPPGE